MVYYDHTHIIFSTFTWNLKHVSYLNSEGVSTTDSGSNKKCFWVIRPVLVSMVTTGKPICRIQRFMITSTVWGSFMPFLSTAWWQEYSNVTTLPLCEKQFRGQQHSAVHFFLIFFQDAMTFNFTLSQNLLILLLTVGNWVTMNNKWILQMFIMSLHVFVKEWLMPIWPSYCSSLLNTVANLAAKESDVSLRNWWKPTTEPKGEQIQDFKNENSKYVRTFLGCGMFRYRQVFANTLALLLL